MPLNREKRPSWFKASFTETGYGSQPRSNVELLEVTSLDSLHRKVSRGRRDDLLLMSNRVTPDRDQNACSLAMNGATGTYETGFDVRHLDREYLEKQPIRSHLQELA